jgi:hypothetical protein
MPPHPELVPRSRVQIPRSYSDRSASPSPFSSQSASCSDSGPAASSGHQAVENEVVDLRAEKAHVTAIVDTFPPIIADLTDEIRQSHGRGAERWEGNERRRDRR